ncbi:MAG: transcription-repair coupling factor [Candidatus Glassbacteria bacterium]
MNLAKQLVRFSKSVQFSELVSCLEKGEQSIFATNLYGSSKSLLAAFLHEELDRTAIFLVGSEEEGRRKVEDLRTLFDGTRVLSMPPLSLRRLDEELPHMEIEEQRMDTLSSLLGRKNVIAVVPALSASQMLISPRRLRDLLIEIRVGDVIDMSGFVRRLEELGYVREDMVIEVGTYSRRGGIVDLYGIRMSGPVRIEFDEDTVVSVREFETATQRSTRVIESTVVIPVEERESGPLECPIFDYLPPDALIFVDEYRDFMSRVEELSARLKDEQSLLGTDGMVSRLSDFQTVGLSSLHLYEPVQEVPSFRFDTREPVSVSRRFTSFLEALERHRREGYQVFLLCDNEGQMERFRELLGTHEDELELVLGSLEQGFLAGDVGLAVYTDHEIFRRPRRIRYLREYRGVEPVESFTSIKPGDYLVHINYGIARYEGIRRIGVGEGEIECLSLTYDGGDRVYVPMDRLQLVEKYSTENAAPPALDRLGSRRWERLKKRTKESIKAMAKELLDLYAARRVIKGFAFSSDTPWQMELESSFIYEDTPDQSKASFEVKRDMQSEAPMDRLVCGDVGYGKTEIAIRASFKAVQDGKQVAVLVPTTVLAQQHLMTFRSRLETFPVKIEMLSRFLTKGEQSQVLEGIAEGSVDIVIGTHRLLSGDIRFKDLGLMIIDEEHRFGVKQKEKLKKMRKHVDVLTLSATPIPRTLYLSLMGMRDMSIIETPPRDRMPIATYVTRWNEELIREAVMREVDRGGQVYFIHNRIKSIDSVRRMLERLLPECRIEVAHGRMHERRLERVMLSFLKGEIDVLLATMIVGSGLDIPNANTLIVNRADMFGLAQLYQLRGRVGRSYRKACAYMLVPPKQYLDAGARRRLRVLEEYTDLGAGYWIALKDLELRGAGNVLGPQQHGFISTMGFDTYYRLLDEAIREMKGEEKKEKQPVEVLAGVEAYLPDEYVGSSDQKLSLYRKLSTVETIKKLNQLKEEIADRFGPLPPVGRNLLKLMEVKILASDLGVKSISLRGNRASLAFSEGFPGNMQRWNEVLGRRSFGLVASWDGRSKFSLESRGSADALESLRNLLQEVSM